MICASTSSRISKYFVKSIGFSRVTDSWSFMSGDISSNVALHMATGISLERASLATWFPLANGILISVRTKTICSANSLMSLIASSPSLAVMISISLKVFRVLSILRTRSSPWTFVVLSLLKSLLPVSLSRMSNVDLLRSLLSSANNILSFIDGL